MQFSRHRNISSSKNIFTQLKIESTTNFIQSLINPKGDQGDDAE